MTRKNLLAAIFFGLSYFVSVQLGTLFIDQGVAYFWPASGVACAFFIFSPTSLWLWYSLIFIPAYLLPLLYGNADYSITELFFLLFANWLQSIAAGVLVKWKVPQRVDLNRVFLQFKLVFYAALVAPLVASAIGVTTFYLAHGHGTWFDYFIFWMIGNCTGILPTIMLSAVVSNWRQNIKKFRPSRQNYERGCYLLFLGALSYAIIHVTPGKSFLASSLQYFIFPALLFSSIRFKAQFTAAAAFFYTSVTAFYSAQGIGPHAVGSLPMIYNVMSFDLFIIILVLSSLLLAAVQSELEFAKLQLQAERNEALKLSELKSLFVANVNHEIRTPITGVLGATSLLRDTQLTKEQARLLGTIEEGGNHLLSLINDVLNLTKLDRDKVQLQLAPVDIETLIHSSAHSFLYGAQEKGLRVYIDCQQHMPCFMADKTAMKQVLSNLISNAVKFTGTGYVLIKARYDEQLHLCIQDTGIGIAPENLDKVFENFVQEDSSMNRRFGGTGLGLSICKKIVDLLNGTIEVQSEKNLGTTFSLSLPLEAIPKHHQQIQADNPRGILLSNDSLLNNILSHQFEHENFHLKVYSWHSDEALASLLMQEDGVVIINWEGTDRDALNEVIQQLQQTQRKIILLLPWSLQPSTPEHIKVLHRPIIQSTLLDMACTNESLTTPELVPDNPPTANPPTFAPGYKVLLAEDNPINTMIARTMLEQQGCQVVSVDNGEKAMQAMDEQSFDFILMDIQMPILDGLQASRAIKERHPSTPIVAFTANYSQQLDQEFRSAGMDLVLCKPFTREQLAKIISQTSTYIEII